MGRDRRSDTGELWVSTRQTRMSHNARYVKLSRDGCCPIPLKLAESRHLGDSRNPGVREEPGTNSPSAKPPTLRIALPGAGSLNQNSRAGLH